MLSCRVYAAELSARGNHRRSGAGGVAPAPSAAAHAHTSSSGHAAVSGGSGGGGGGVGGGGSHADLSALPTTYTPGSSAPPEPLAEPQDVYLVLMQVRYQLPLN